MTLYLVTVRLDRLDGQRPSSSLPHAVMEAAGYVQHIHALDGHVKKLPSDSYLKSTQAGPAAVLLEVEKIANRYIGVHEIIIARATDVRVSGLEPLAPAAGLEFRMAHPDIREI